jgi:hypothetical protein
MPSYRTITSNEEPETVLTRIEGKIHRVEDRLTKVEIGVTDIKGDIKGLAWE